jgi:hypothetical protein
VTWLAELLRDAPPAVLIAIGALACGLFLAWCMRAQDWYLPEDDAPVVSSLYECRRERRP